MADEKHVEILLSGVEAWNHWRALNPDVRVDLHDADLRDAELPGANLRNAVLNSCDFRDAVLDGADLSSAIMNHAVLKGARLRRAVLVGVDAQNANFETVDASDANLSEGTFRNAGFTSAVLISANLSGADFKDARLISCDLNHANLSSTDFRDANMQQVVLVGAFIENGDFRRCQLANANLRSARLAYARFRNAALKNAVLDESFVANADFRQAKALTCEQLTQAIDWQAAYRDPELACGAEIPEPREIAVAEADTVDQIFATSSSRWRDYVGEDERNAQLERSRAALEELANILSEFPAQIPNEMIGHNQPPEPIASNEVASQLLADVRAGIALHDAPRPDKLRLEGLRRNIDRFQQWIQPRIDLAADEAAKSFGKRVGDGFGAAILVALGVAIAQLTGLINMLF